jgi:DtxR family Mn-dependent transcriptional regulator
LTAAGRKLAIRMLRRHRLIELFLVQTLDLSWDQVHEEAENMEHAVSDFLVDRIDEYLGHPHVDPHGDPIPTADGRMRGDAAAAVPLTQCEAGAHVRFVRVMNQDPEFLRYLSESDFAIGGKGIVRENNREAEIVTLSIGRRSFSMGHSAAQCVLVETG